MSHHDSTSNSYFEQYFTDRLAQIDDRLAKWARFVYAHASEYDREEAQQKTRIVLWKRYSKDPDDWAPQPAWSWLAFAKAVYRFEILGDYRNRMRKPVNHASEMPSIVNERDVTDDEVLSLVHLSSKSKPTQFTHPREMHLVELRIDLERCIERGLQRLCASQQRDMPLLIEDMLAGYTLDEITARHGWTRNRGVTLMRKLRTVFYEELTGRKKTGYLGSHHPLTNEEKQRIRELYASGLSYRKVAARVGRSASAVEGICKQYPPEIVAQVQALRAQGLSMAQIARQVGRSKSYVGWLVQAEGVDDLVQYATEKLGAVLVEGCNWPTKRDGDNLAPVPVSA
ncbi:MAG: helix-turn-helix domain-containing protein [Anaerolineae bacterium]|nr:helix-turn-helix domain-containing protein [Anaerolineae bacterium]